MPRTVVTGINILRVESHSRRAKQRVEVLQANYLRCR